ncbi:hypothetical protein [Dyella mobilis]|uniref:Sulfotransferase family protein n=1 Tax=Dyella mobilis TaxID=1849582 RepID=A0ABS2KN08_9GAMM|nr:hypothetical protein [Dyella mobilis]MBM7132355.1 hypothetical protein [Dyella mobilis]GLQ95657.1 hypothetical protein GCM10007863_00750 [Dyella mobilis]
MPDHPVLIHYHIFKNAGSSVDASLQHSFGDRWGSFEGPHAHAIQSSAQLGQHLAANPQLIAISSHLARPPIPHPRCLPMVFIRHPLLRAYSVYSFTRTDASQPYSDVAQDLGFAEYIAWALRKEPGSIVIRDYQVVHLSDASWRTKHILDAEAGAADLDQACRLLTEWGVAGVVDQFELSIQVFQATYGPHLPGLDLHARWENATHRNPVAVDERVDQLRQMLGNGLYEDFMEANRLDLALHAHAQSVLASAAQREKLRVSSPVDTKEAAPIHVGTAA